MNSARARIHNAREEREKFDEASNQILMHLKAKVLLIFPCQKNHILYIIELLNYLNFPEENYRAYEESSYYIILSMFCNRRKMS